MTSTDTLQNHEMRLIFEISKKLHHQGIGADMFSKPEPTRPSYFTAPDIPNLFSQSIFDYDFSAPVQLKALLEKMWLHQGYDSMLQFSAVVTVATFKNRAAMSSAETGIPSYVYAF